jgi:hypothetical protein
VEKTSGRGNACRNHSDRCGTCGTGGGIASPRDCQHGGDREVKRLLPYIAVALLLLGAGLQFPAVADRIESAAAYVSSLWQRGPVTDVIVIEETQTRTAAQAAVLFGPTAKAALAAKKWNKPDKDSIPASIKLLVDKAPPKSVPWLILVRGQAVAWSGPMPETEAAFASKVKQYGGL